MIQAIDLKPGHTFEHEGNLYAVLDILHNKTAMRKMICKTKVKNLRTGAITEFSFSGDDKFNEIHPDKRKMQYLYDEGDSLVFMDNESYDQVSIPKENLKWELNFITANLEVEVTYFEKEILGIVLPPKVTLLVTKSDPGVKGDTATRALKPAILETGLEIKVPLFVEEGDKVVVKTDTGAYDSRG